MLTLTAALLSAALWSKLEEDLQRMVSCVTRVTILCAVGVVNVHVCIPGPLLVPHAGVSLAPSPRGSKDFQNPKSHSFSYHSPVASMY